MSDSNKGDNIDVNTDKPADEKQIKKLPVLVKMAKKVQKKQEFKEEKKEMKQPETKRESNQEWVIREVKGRRKMADGTIKEYTYNRRYPKKTHETRGRRKEPCKSKLRNSIKELSNDQCQELLDYIKDNFVNKKNSIKKQEEVEEINEESENEDTEADE